jgi:hypothetical protein
MEIILAAILLAQQPPCGPTGVLEQQLLTKYGEQVVAAGITPAGKMFTLANPATGSFSVIVRRPDGLTCLVIGGDGFTTIDAIKPGTDL